MRARARARARVCVCVCVYVCEDRSLKEGKSGFGNRILNPKPIPICPWAMNILLLNWIDCLIASFMKRTVYMNNIMINISVTREQNEAN